MWDFFLIIVTTKMLEDVPYREELKGVHSIAEPELIQT